MSLIEKVAYIKGVVDGIDFDTNTNEGKIIGLLLDLVDDISHELTELKEQSESLEEYVEEIDEDLGYLEDVVFEDSNDEFDSDDYCDCCDGNCEECECDGDCDDCESGGTYDFFEVVCPTCNEQVYLDNSIDPSNVVCPACHNEFSVIDNN